MSFFGGVPDHIVIDVTNVCNLRCPVCPIPFDLTRKRGMMTIETFRSLIADLVKANKRPRITFNWSGEPTLNKCLPDMVAYASQNGFETILSSNVQRLNADIAARLVDARLTIATMCMDGFDAAAHEGYLLDRRLRP